MRFTSFRPPIKSGGKNVMIFIASNMNEKFIKLTQLMTVRMQLIFSSWYFYPSMRKSLSITQHSTAAS
jgi:hypothetical protein